MASPSRSLSDFFPPSDLEISKALVHPAIVPATVLAAKGPRNGILLNPLSK